MKGKNKCKILKEIRKAIALENDIEYVTTECKFKGDCSGTCPKCEAEVRYLEAELEKRRAAGKTVAVAGIAASMILSSGCVFSENNPFSKTLQGDMMISEESSHLLSEESSEQLYDGVAPIPESEMVDGEIYMTGQEIIASSYEQSESSEESETQENSENSEEPENSEVFLPESEAVDGEIYMTETMGEFPAPED